MNGATLVLPTTIAEAIDAASRGPAETAGVILAMLCGDGESAPWRLLARSIHWVPDSAILERSSRHLKITSDGYVPALGVAETLGAVPIWFHTHPGFGNSPSPSEHDHQVDRDIAHLFRLRSGSSIYSTLIVSKRNSGFAFSGTIQPDGKSAVSIEKIWCVGERFWLVNAVDSASPGFDDMFDRNVKAFGGSIQSVLGQLKIAIIGCGGTGSALSEQLVRLGVRQLSLFDPDQLSRSNVTRVYGSTLDDVGKLKVDILSEHLRRIAPDLACEAIPRSILSETVARELTGFDLVFGCTDDNAGRLILSRIPTFLLTPLIDVGVLISSESDGTIRSIDGRVTVVTPGSACLVCRDRIDLQRAADEMRTPDERQRLAGEGYATALPGIEPAVVTFTTAVAAAAVNEMLERLSGFGPVDRPNEVLIRFHEREISTNSATSRAGHYCHPDSQKMGSGPGQPYLEVVWP